MEWLSSALALLCSIPAWLEAHPGWAFLGFFALSSVLSAIPPLYVFRWRGLAIPVGAIAHSLIANLGHLARKVAEVLAPRYPIVLVLLRMIPGAAPRERRR